MNQNTTRSFCIVALLASAPLVSGADGRGCGQAHPPASTAADGGTACEAQRGEHCGGNTAHPCSCVSGLVCTPAAGGLPSGDVGGTCEPRASGAAGSAAGAGTGSAGVGHVTDGGQASPTDGGACVSRQDEHCGGNTTHPCNCAPGLMCMLKLGGPAPGDVGGTCQPADAGANADGGACVSDEGQHCGGNTTRPCSCAPGLMCAVKLGGPAPGDVGGTCKRVDAGMGADGGACVSDQGEQCGGNIAHPCSCASGLVCTPAAGGPPAGDVGGTCQLSATSTKSCSRDADCTLNADYCTGCDCVALAPGQSVKPCSGPGVRCLVDPCGMKTAACQNGACVAR